MNCGSFSQVPKEENEKDRLIDYKDYINYIKIIFFTLLVCAIAGVGGYFIYMALLNNSYIIYNNQYESATDEIHDIIDSGLNNNFYVTQSLAAAVSAACPTIDIWPNCSIPMASFKALVFPLIKIGLLRDMTIVPVIYPPTNQASFEAYAYYIFSTDPAFPKGAGISSFGKGIYSRYANKTVYHDRTGKTSFSTINVLTPVFELSDPVSSKSALMYNLHSEKNRAAAIDYVITAFGKGKRNTSSVTNFIQLVQDTTLRPACILAYPITPVNNPSSLTGLVTVIHNWDTIIQKATPPSTNGIDIVLSTTTTSTGMISYTFTLKNGQVILKGSGDLHEAKYNNMKQSHGSFSAEGYRIYSILYYPNNDYYPNDINTAAIVGCTAYVVVIILLAFSFVMYDYYSKLKLQKTQDALDSKRTFVRFISHEIRTPLNTVCLGLKVLETETKEVSDSNSFNLAPEVVTKLTAWRELISEIQESSGNAVVVLNELMSYDKIEMKTLQLELEILPIWELISDSVKPFNIQAREKGIEMDLAMDVDLQSAAITDIHLLLIVGDPIKLSQVFRNVVSNALKFSPIGSKVSITVNWLPDRLLDEGAEMAKLQSSSKRFLEAAGSIRLSVQDSGAGLSEDQLKQLFKEGVQFNANKLQSGGGSGLGLWITKGIVNLHKGTIVATSEGLGHGATFTVELPVVKHSKDSIVTEIDHNYNKNNDHCSEISSVVNTTSISPYLGLRVNNILIVDDAASNRKMLKRFLVAIDCKVTEASDGVEFLDLIKSMKNSPTEFDLILLDSEMPRMTGPEAVKEFRKLGFTTLVFGLTGNVLRADVEDFIDHGANLVLSKPLSMDKLTQMLSEFKCASFGNKELVEV